MRNIPENRTINPEMSGRHLHIAQTPEASAGVFDHINVEAESLAKFLAANTQALRNTSEDDTYGHRDKFSLTIQLPNGESIMLYFKTKFSKVGTTGQIIGAQEQMLVIKDELAIGNTTEAHKEMLWSSVLHELNINLEAQERYKNKYNENLPIEQPVGFVVDREGRKWAIFRFIGNIIKTESLPMELQYIYRAKAKNFATIMEQRLKMIGIDPQEIDKENSKSPVLENMVFVGDPNSPDSATPIIIDSEEWSYL